MKHVVVYKEPGRFAGWPANHGAWSWGNEIVVAFVSGHMQQKAKGHAIDWAVPRDFCQARTLDGGETWAIEVDNNLRSTQEGGPEPQDFVGDIPLENPDVALTFRMPNHIQDGALSRFFYSTDRCRNWVGPFQLPLFGQRGIKARTDYVTRDGEACLVFLTAVKPDGREGHPFCARMTQGGRRWEFLSWIGPEPDDWGLMPAVVRLSGERYLAALRIADRKGGSRRDWIENYVSTDGCRSWSHLNVPVTFPEGSVGNPPSLIKLHDGRILLTYGYRVAPYGIRAKVSADEGRTWGDEIVLRSDGGNWDLGYPRSVQRPDGKIVTVYYFDDAPEGERYIAATIWDV